MLIKRTRSLCPACKTVVDAEVEEEGGKIWLTQHCPEHGTFRNIYWSDAALYHRFDRYNVVGNGIANPQVTRVTADTCPAACGLCNNHHSQTLLANIDLTNRCNLDCDFCFANARACGFVYEPDFDEVVSMLKLLRSEKPVPAPAVQFSGGEPTMRDDLFEIIREAKALGFKQVQIATNGIRIAASQSYTEELKATGLNTVYLHFDGVSRETNPFLKKHLQAIGNLEKVRLGTVLVPTVIKGRNDHEIGDIIRFAAGNVRTIRGVNFQPVAFTGAASDDDLKKSRITIPDVLDRIEAQMGGILKKEDFYPVPCVLPFSDLVEAYTGKPQVRFTAHQHCGAATYIFVQEDGIVPVNRMVNVEKFFETIEQMAGQLRQGGTINKYKTLLEGVKNMHDSVKEGEQAATTEFWKIIGKTLIGQNFEALREFHWNALFIGTMHFMDRYNYDLDRVSRCCIHYATPDGKLIPFCTYNSGPVYREQVWKKFAKAK
ncbi:MULTISPECIES: tetraether lipid synthase Tes [unclassified Methanoregula]|uniref:tetraether lipid synthase Tes n=1 Tax=unclassified Methanoregula TaxID=2649730 RepID=UPI0009CCD975|nr:MULTISPECIES: radical SAM protein [unclassified Methanoregula]OPX62933.1 MAG: molybdenum cofactor biosynthesis protein A [Methanoregula sp. PtaB.Bin085]OPY35146.1 MAG: molybdenum cofactor biosynthesis protein A [Methanoregula sp. PtaU1.Bin006]